MEASSIFGETYLNIFENLEASFSEGYILKSTIMSIIVGIMLCAFVIVAVILTKKNIGFGITTGILQLFGAVATQKYVHAFCSMNWVQFETFYGSSQSDVQNQINDFYAEYFTEVMGSLLSIVVCSVFILLAWVFGLIFIIKNMKLLPKAFPIIALIIHIIRYVAITPYDIITATTQKITDATQQSYDAMNYIICMIPFALLLIGSIVYKTRSKKSKIMEVSHDGENWSVKL